MGSRRRALRCIVNLGVFLLLGAAVNVAVAWSLGAWSPYTGSFAREATDVELARVVKHGETVKFKETMVSSGRGIRNTYTPILDAALDAETRRMLASGAFVNFRVATPAVCVIESGFPCLAVKSVHVLHSSTFTTPMMLESQGGILLRNHVAIEGHPIGWMPVLPGFAINTIFYAAGEWALFAAPFVIRKGTRIKRGLCPTCAYPVGASEACSECGHAVKT